MDRAFFVAILLIIIPMSACLPAGTVFAAASSFSAAQALLSASSSPGNLYVGGASIVITAPVAGDLSVIGGGVVVAAPVAGDELLLAGSIDSRAAVGDDFRAIGGSITVGEAVAGDLVAIGPAVHDSGRAGGSVFIVALNTTISNGASGPVTVYGNNVSLAGNFANDVTIIAGGHVGIAENTIIRGKLSYEAPEPISIPESAVINGGIEYKNISYLPNAGTSRILTIVGVGIFLLVRVLGALILAGLLTGLFPRFTQSVVDRASTKHLRSVLLTLVLGFALLVATPILLVMLALTFVGIGVALLLLVAYVLIVFLALIYAGILVGGVFARWYARHETVLWYDGVFGMLAFSIISLIPIIGVSIVFLLTALAAGALIIIFFNFAFSSEDANDVI